MSIRIQRRRAKGWRMPPGAILVGRPSKWGNPYRVGERFNGVVLDRAAAVFMFRSYAVPRAASQPDWLAPLRGHDLACWCRLVDQPCHADVLLELANQ